MNPDATRLVLESRRTTRSATWSRPGQLVSVVDAMGREMAYTYYWPGWLEGIKHIRRNANGSIALTVLVEKDDHDFAGNVVRKTEASGGVRDDVYDSLGKPHPKRCSTPPGSIAAR